VIAQQKQKRLRPDQHRDSTQHDDEECPCHLQRSLDSRHDDDYA